MSSISKSSSDSKVMSKLEENAGKINISVEELIDQYIKLGLYEDDYYEPRSLTKEEIREVLRKDDERDRKMGVPPMKHNFDEIVGLFNRYED